MKVIEKYKPLAENKKIKIEIINNCELIILNNSYYLDRLFWNVLSNAIFYNNWNNNIQIIIEKDKVIIKDEWIWIKKDELEKIFTRFYRNKDSWLYYKNWNWLWLVIVKKICDIFWWKISINSEIWEWTKIKINI